MVGKNHYCPEFLKDLDLKWLSVDLQFAPYMYDFCFSYIIHTDFIYNSQEDQCFDQYHTHS